MPEMTRYQHGVPSWVDLGTHDVAAGLRFYSELLGWEGQDTGEETGHYTIVTKAGKQVAAIGSAQDPGPPCWTTYVNVDSVDDVAKRAESAGATVIVPPMDVMTAGRMVLFQDTTGAAIAAWQPGDHLGAQLVNEPGAVSWNELTSSGAARSKEFYTAVFGWGWGGGEEYPEAQVGGRTIAGLFPRTADIPAEVPDHWMVYFGSTDVDADAQKTVSLGGTVLAGPKDIPDTGRIVVLADPQGAAFALFQG